MKLFGAVSRAGWQTVSRLGIVLLIALVIGLAIGHVALMLALAFAGVAAIQVWNVLRLEYWLARRRVESAPDLSGVWGEVVAIVSRIYRRKNFYRSRVTGLLREFRRMTTALPEGAVLLGPEHEILWFNRLAGQWLGLRRKRDFGIRIENLVRHPAFVEYLRTGTAAEGVSVHDPGEGNRWLSFHVVRTGTAERQLLIVRDVSRQQQLESMRKDFVANASHELRSPLTVITGYLDALADDQKLDATWNAPVHEMRRQAERMGSIINSLLELSRLEAGVRTQEEQPVDVAGMLALMRKDASMQERYPKVSLRLESDARLLGVESEIHSIVSNLLSNAAKFTPADGRIELAWSTDAAGAHISVRDTGCGIAPEHIPRLTERFYRVDAGRARTMGGSGLGLAIVKHALQRHGGTLTIESREGHGSMFACHFPVSRIVPRRPVSERPRKLAAD